MRILLSTDFLRPRESKNFSQALDQFDPTFSSRYLEDGNEWKGVISKHLRGERHWESDKYEIFYLTIDPSSLQPMMDVLKKEDCCLLIGEADENYCLKGDPFFRSEIHSKTFPDVPQNMKIRPSSFQPRKPQASMPSQPLPSPGPG